MVYRSFLFALGALLFVACGARSPVLDAPWPANGLDDGAAAIAGQLDGLRWELPCLGSTEWPEVCACADSADVATQLRGNPDQIYTVTVRLRGVVEQKAYIRGAATGYVSRGGSPADDDWNVYALTVDDPPMVYFLNHGTSRLYYTTRLDYQLSLEIRGGSAVRLHAESFDLRQIRNRDPNGEPLRVPDVAPHPGVYDGQFLQMDVLGVR
ncbi:MAG: hypothetical protein H6707_01640 [Deltaproteobacteria bacterium]|nr:hypothetical protein [Deltaproteobacteria bacterium]